MSQITDVDVSVEELFGMGTHCDLLLQRLRTTGPVAGSPQTFDYGGGVTAILGKEAVAPFAGAVRDRIDRRATGMEVMGFQLKQSAWRYSSSDRGNADRLAQEHSRIENFGGYQGYFVDPMANAAQYPPGDEPDLTIPEPSDTDFRSVVDASTGILTEIDKHIYEVTKWMAENVTGGDDGWSPLGQMIEPLTGNWGELERAGDSFEKSGAACEGIAQSLKSGSERLDHSWHGQASTAYLDYSANMVKAIDWEGPVGRIAKAILVAASEQIQAAGTALLDRVNQIVEDRIVKAGLKDVVVKVATRLAAGPLGGWLFVAESAYNIGRTLWDIYQESVQTYNKINALISDTKAVFEALQNPADTAQATLAEKVSNVQERIDAATQQVEVGMDVAEVAAGAPAVAAVNQHYSAPTGTAAWEA